MSIRLIRLTTRLTCHLRIVALITMTEIWPNSGANETCHIAVHELRWGNRIVKVCKDACHSGNHARSQEA